MNRGFLSIFVLFTFSISACRCSQEHEDLTPSFHWISLGQLGERGQAIASLGDNLVVAVDGKLMHSTDGGENWFVLPGEGLPPGTAHFIEVLDNGKDSTPILLVGIFRKGLFHSKDLGRTFFPPKTPMRAGLMAIMNNRAIPVPFGATGDSLETWVAGLGMRDLLAQHINRSPYSHQ